MGLGIHMLPMMHITGYGAIIAICLLLNHSSNDR